MSFLKGILTDLRQRRLWPVPLALIAAIVAAPVVLSKSAQPPQMTPLPSTGRALPGTPVARVTDNASPGKVRLTGNARDPFSQQKLAAPSAKTISTGGSTASAGATAQGGTGTGTGSAGTGNTGGATSSTPSTSPASTPPAARTIPNTQPKPAPSGLTAMQSYHVALSITDPSGGVNPIDPLERLSVLPNGKQPLLVELGVLQGGHSVLFAVQPGTVVTGPGHCTPGSIDCEILSLAPGKTETVSTQSPSGTVEVAQFQVTSITVDDHASVAAADQARRKESAAGRQLLNKSSAGALSLFQYDPTVGAVVDLRNLTVGGGN